MTEAKIKSTPDEELQYRSQEVKANNKTIITPIKSIDYSKIDTKILDNKKIECVNELYAGISDKNVKKMIEGSDNSITSKLNNIKNKSKNRSKELKFCFLEFKGESMPTIKEIELMINLAHIHSDITPIPMLYNFNKRVGDEVIKGTKKKYILKPSKFKSIEKYLKNTIETIEQRNNKPIMGYIPDYRYYFEKFIKIYVDRGINTFYFDAHGSTPVNLHTSLRAFRRELNRQNMLEKSFIHLINPGYGRASKGSTKIPARDILGFGLGIDSLGEKHIQMKFPRTGMVDNRSKLFNKKTYSYLKSSKKDEIKEFYPKDSKIDMSEFLNSGKADTKIERAFNVEQLSLEGTHLKNNIIQSDSILDYINKKADIKKEDIKILQRASIN